MPFVDDWMSDACLELGIRLVRLERDESIETVAAITRRHGLRCSYGDLSSRLHASASFMYEEAWKAIADYPHEGPVFCFADSSMSRRVYKFDSIRIVSRVLGETPWFNWYVTDVEYAFLLAQSDNDIFFGSGKASQWVIDLGRAMGRNVRLAVTGT